MRQWTRNFNGQAVVYCGMAPTMTRARLAVVWATLCGMAPYHDSTAEHGCTALQIFKTGIYVFEVAGARRKCEEVAKDFESRH